MRKIIIDLYGCDNGPKTIIKGASLLLDKQPDLKLVLVGDQKDINQYKDEFNLDMSRVEIIHTEEYISNNENIVEAISKKKNSSIILSAKALAEDNDAIGLLTAGNSGAIIVSGLKYLSTKELTRPCIASLLPSAKGGFVCLLDCGANIDCVPSQLHSFAKLGTQFYKDLYGVESPKVGLLSNGREDSKGNKLVKETFPILKEDSSINFIGNIEGSDVLSGECDVIVADGFSGNQVLKVSEGTCKQLITDIVKLSKKTNHPEYMEVAKYLMSQYDLTSLGGAIVLGIRKPIIKCHGNCNENTIVNTGEMLINLNNHKTVFDGIVDR